MLKKLLGLSSATILVFSLAGCGSDNREVADNAGTAALQASQACISCHADNKLSPVTGAKIVDEWKRGAHNTKNGASCVACHQPNGHPNGGSITSNPADTICKTCHTAPAKADATSQLQAHFNVFTSSTVNAVTGAVTKFGSATYVTTQELSQCRVCHNPHDNSSVMQINRDWADSGHGDVKSPAFAERNWPTSSPCVRCHTSTGYLSYVNSPTKTISTFTGNKEVVACKTCHEDYSWKRRALAAAVGIYSSSSGNADPALKRFTYPNAGTSNICLNCHVGREIGDNLKNNPATSDFGNKSFENSHYLTGGATLYGVSGYENFLGVSGGTNRTYTATVAHQGLGLTVPNTGTGTGPCVACHMTNSTSHKFKPLSVDASGTITGLLSSAICTKCHGVAAPATAAWSTVAELDGRHKQSEAALEALKAQLETRKIFFKEAHPYFYNKANPTSTSTDALKNWANPDGTTVGATVAARRLIGEPNMGAAFNYNLLKHDPGAFAHNRWYARQLIYDAIDWLDDYTMNNSTGNTLNALPAGTTYKAGAMTYLLVNGTATGTAAERPAP